MSECYVNVAIAAPIPGPYTYRVHKRVDSSTSLLGCRVVAPLGSRGVTGVVVEEDVEPPAGVTIKYLHIILDTSPTVPPELVEVSQWVANYYSAPIGETLRLALPPGTGTDAKISVGALPMADNVAEGGLVSLSPKGEQLYKALSSIGSIDRRKMMKMPEYSAPVFRELVACHAVFVKVAPPEDKAKPKKVSVIHCADSSHESMDASTKQRLLRAPKRKEVWDYLVAKGRKVPLSDVVRDITGGRGHVRKLVEHGLATIVQEAADSTVWNSDEKKTAVRPRLTAQQEQVATTLISNFHKGSFASFLLHGVTGSGKTEIYLRLIEECLNQNKTAIVLVPEISLTPQLGRRFCARFGDKVAVLHSGLTLRRRFDEWQRLRRGEAKIALGARSAVFAPVTNLGVVVVDEEHDGSFKQEEGVRYHARNVALVRAKKAKATCVLGSATPSLESYTRAKEGGHSLLELLTRPTPQPVPKAEVIDLRTYIPSEGDMLSAPLADAIANNLQSGGQTILFLNRRGFENIVTCGICSQFRDCPSCAIRLTYHQGQNILLCHYCGHQDSLHSLCSVCGKASLVRRRGVGTEKVVEGLQQRFPEARIDRLDRDVVRGTKLQTIVGRMDRRETDILVGTQMITKGHDFPGVTLVGVLLADVGLSMPDFRASEKCFQLLAQVSGRAGRGNEPGSVLIQSYQPKAPAVICAANNDYKAFVEQEIAVRSELGYPPSGHLVAIRLDGKNESQVANAAQRTAKTARFLAKGTSVQILGPVEAPIAKLRARYRWQVWLRGSNRREIRQVAHRTVAPKGNPSVRILLDIDPLSTM